MNTDDIGRQHMFMRLQHQIVIDKHEIYYLVFKNIDGKKLHGLMKNDAKSQQIVC
jgi:hypothetical protein